MINYSDDDAVEKEGSDDELKKGVYYDLFEDEERLSQDSVHSALTPEKKANPEGDDKNKDKDKAVVRIRKKINILTFKPNHLTSERGLYSLVNEFPRIEFRGEGHEKHDLQLLMRNYEHWGNRLFPKLRFPDLLDRIETFGSKAEVKVCVKHIRNGGRVPYSAKLGDGFGEDELAAETVEVVASNDPREGSAQELTNEDVNALMNDPPDNQFDYLFDMVEPN